MWYKTNGERDTQLIEFYYVPIGTKRYDVTKQMLYVILLVNLKLEVSFKLDISFPNLQKLKICKLDNVS